MLAADYGFPIRQPLVVGAPQTVARLLAELV
jgi:hypothetical protein